MTVVQLAKYQALGNDYLLLELPADEDGVVRTLPRLCDRHRGVGADGLLLEVAEIARAYRERADLAKIPCVSHWNAERAAAAAAAQAEAVAAAE